MPETIRTLEGVWEQRLSGGLYGAISVYQYTMKDLIDQVEDPSDGFIQHQNINDVKASGVEMELSYHSRSGVRGRASYSYQRARDKGSNQTLTNSPAHLVRAGAAIPLGRHLILAPQLQYEGERKTVQDTKTDAYVLSDLTLSVRPGTGKDGRALFDHVELSLNVRNALDREYATPGGFEHVQPGITQNGRNYMARIRLTF